MAPMLHSFTWRNDGLTKSVARRVNMLETIAIILIVLWLLGLVSGYTMGNFIYVLLISGRRVV
jgi:hypothetical protein